MEMLCFMVVLPLLASLGMWSLSLIKKDVSRRGGLYVSLMLCILSAIVWSSVNGDLVMRESYWGVSLGVDSVSILFVLLSSWVFPMCMIFSWNRVAAGSFMSALLLLESFVMGVFLVENVLYFYMCFEAVLIPVFVLMGSYGSRGRKVRAGYYLFLYTVGGSVLLLLGIMLLYLEMGSLEFRWILEQEISESRKLLIWLLMFMGFMVKIPLLPFHIWLAEAHVEAPTEVSVLLASLLLKLGTFGMMRYSMELLEGGACYYRDMVSLVCALGILYTSLSALRQTDMKRVIAYGSVGHMSLVVLGLICGSVESYVGAIVQMLAHGLVSGGLFFGIGVLYERVKSRQVWNITGMVELMPVWSVLMLMLMLGNMSLPGTMSFVGEFLVLLGVWKLNRLMALVCGAGMFLTGCYSVYLLNRLLFGNRRDNVGLVSDVNVRELSILLPLVFWMLLLGMVPNVVMENMSVPERVPVSEGIV